nr:hypothetical protein [Burkholderia ubonensis]
MDGRPSPAALALHRARGDGRRCSVEFAYQRPDDGTLPRIGPLTCALR